MLSFGNPGYRHRVRERFGYISPRTGGKRPLWVHAVSVGEVIASETLVRQFLMHYPDVPVFITTTTPTGSEQVVRSFGNRVELAYAPYDLPGSVVRFHSRLNPCGLIVMETELWPNWILQLSRWGAPILLANGRMSDKSERGYARFGVVTRAMFSGINCIGAQSQEDAARFRSLGATDVRVTGNLKADFVLDSQVRAQAAVFAEIFGLQHPEKVVIAASTHPGEDALLIEAFHKLWRCDPGLRLVLVPRHPERSADIARLLDRNRMGHVLRSSEFKLDNENPVLICDRLGELRALCGLGCVAVMGGTLVDHGGHNPLEPAAWSSALLAGPSQHNFHATFESLEQAGAMLRVSPDVEDIANALGSLLGDQERIGAMGRAAEGYLHASRGATRRTLDLVHEVIRPTRQGRPGI